MKVIHPLVLPFQGNVFTIRHLMRRPDVRTFFSRNTHPWVLQVGDGACRSMLLLVVLLMWCSCYTATTHRASAYNNKQQCCWLSMSIVSRGGTAVKSAALVAAPLGLAVLAVATVCSVSYTHLTLPTKA